MQVTVWIFLIFGGLLLIAGVFGNALVILYFGFRIRCRKNHHLFLLILGIADFLASLSNFMFEWPGFIPSNSWRFGAIGCTYVWPIGISINTTACYILVAMFYARYRSIVDPVNNRITKKKIIVSSLVILGGSLVIHVPLVVGMVYKNGYCYFDYIGVFRNNINYELYRVLAIFVVRFLIPAVVMSLLFYQIKKCLSNTAAQFKNEIVNKRNARVTRTLLSLIIVFVVSVGLCQFLTLFQAIVVFSNWKDGVWWKIEWYMKLFHCLSAFYYLNYAVNFFIYACDMPKFRMFLSSCYSSRKATVKLNRTFARVEKTKVTKFD